jgi:hypothetical protein
MLGSGSSSSSLAPKAAARSGLSSPPLSRFPGAAAAAAAAEYAPSRRSQFIQRNKTNQLTGTDALQSGKSSDPQSHTSVNDANASRTGFSSTRRLTTTTTTTTSAAAAT